jgi:redox-sensitive bicupin YhaK (pirin superfamily)
LNERNDGRQILPCDGVRGLTKTRLSSGAQWELGDPGDAERGVIKDTRLAANERIAAHRHEDWHAIIVLGGSLHVAGKTLEKDSYLVIRPQSQVDELQAGPQGAQLLELSRTRAL